MSPLSHRPLKALVTSTLPDRALRDGELFEIVIQKMVDRWSGSIEAGEGPSVRGWGGEGGVGGL